MNADCLTPVSFRRISSLVPVGQGDSELQNPGGRNGNIEGKEAKQIGLRERVY